MVYGFGCEGLFEPATAEEALGLIDEQGLAMWRVENLATGQQFTWLRYFMGDTEVGHIFAENSLTLVARINDGDVVECRRD